MGLTALDGGDTPWLHMARRIHAAIAPHEDALLRARPLPSRVAILSSGEGEVFTWCISGGTDLYYRSVKGLFDIVYGANYPVDIIREHQLTADELQRYDCLIVPFPYYLRAPQAGAIRDWVASGGLLISEALFAGYAAERNLHETTVPGQGFSEVFGAVEDAISTVRPDGASDRADGAVALSFEGGTAYGHHFRQSFRLEGGAALARYAGGEIAAAVHAYGEGRAVIVGTLLGAQYEKTRDKGTAAFVRGLLARFHRHPPLAECEGHVDLLFDGESPAFCVVQAPRGGGEFSLSSPTSRTGVSPT